jgi:two-component sensor histidine kinase
VKIEDPQPQAWYKSLRFRLVAMMSLAMLPIGLIAVSQTRSVTEQASQNAELALLGLTEQAAAEERLIIQRAFGLAAGIGAFLPKLPDDPATCSTRLEQVVENASPFTFIGYLPVSGKMVCSSALQEFDFSDNADFADTVAAEAPRIEVNSGARVNEGSVINISQPVFDDDILSGFVTISIPHTALDALGDDSDQEALVDLLIFNNEGEILSSRNGIETAVTHLPLGVNLAGFSGMEAQTFSRQSVYGKERIYAVVPIENGHIYALGVWDRENGVSDEIRKILPTSLFPGLMWVISLAVALFAIHRLVSRHILSVGAQMTRFADNRTLLTNERTAEMPSELQNIQASFLAMAHSILRDEAELEDSVRQQKVLLKEVHHRVKNNLQLISSILNMQIREAEHEDTKRVLRRMQDRVLSLATIHRDLYQTSTGGLVNVGELVREIIDRSVEIASPDPEILRVSADIDDVMLYPDQAVPMSLLASEAATNAMKYVGETAGVQSWVSVSFKRHDDDSCVFEFANSVGEDNSAESTGMGAKLINAFAIQLGAEIEIEQDAENYRMIVTFEAATFEHEPADF